MLNLWISLEYHTEKPLFKTKQRLLQQSDVINAMIYVGFLFLMSLFCKCFDALTIIIVVFMLCCVFWHRQCCIDRFVSNIVLLSLDNIIFSIFNGKKTQLFLCV
jgi:hypothetical protein